jgi:hypothetical protein
VCSKSEISDYITIKWIDPFANQIEVCKNLYNPILQLVEWRYCHGLVILYFIKPPPSIVAEHDYRRKDFRHYIVVSSWSMPSYSLAFSGLATSPLILYLKQGDNVPH